MNKFCQFVVGPAGSGKSTFCSTIISHITNGSSTRVASDNVNLVNLDPAADYFDYVPSIDIKELINVQDVMDKSGCGPNGSLIYCMEYLLRNFDWLEEKLEELSLDYIIIDCPGQIELYMHYTIMKQIVDKLSNLGYSICGVYILDSQFTQDIPKFYSGVMSTMSTMIQMEIPFINILSKMDLIDTKQTDKVLNSFLDVSRSSEENNNKYDSLNKAIFNLIKEFDLVNFVPLNIKDNESIEFVLSSIEQLLQIEKEPKEVVDDYNDDDDMEY